MDWNPVNSYALAALATAAVPGLDVSAVALSNLTDDFAFATAEDSAKRRWVIRLPRHKAAATAADAEVKLLRSLDSVEAGRSLPFEVINPVGFATSPDGLTAMVYREPPGDPLVVELLDPGPGLAASIGRALAALHELPPALAVQAGLPSQTPQDYRNRLRQEVDRGEGSELVTPQLIARWREKLEMDALWVFSPVVIHGDIAPEHIMVQGGRVTALLDLAGARVSDPAEDLAPLLTAGPPDVAESILAAYRGARTDLDSSNLEERIGLLAEIAVIRWLFHGLDHQDSEIINDARSMLASLDQAVSEELAEASRMAAQAEENRQRLEAAQRASAAAAREHLHGQTLDRWESRSTDLPTELVEPDQWQAGGQAGSITEEDQLPAGLDGQDDQANEADFWPGPQRRSVTVDGIDMWGQTKSPTETWEGDESATAAATPPPGFDPAAGDQDTAEATFPPPGFDPPTTSQESALGLDPADNPTDAGIGQAFSLEQDQALEQPTVRESGLPDFLQDSAEAPMDLPKG